MKVNLINCLFVLYSEKNNNIRKNDIKKIKLLVDLNNHVPEIQYNGRNMKDNVRKNISSIIGSNIFHLEQVYTMDYNDSLDVIYLGVTNIENITNLNSNYKLIDFNVENNSIIVFDNKKYNYNTIEKEENNNIEYVHNISVKDSVINRDLLNALISYKKIRSNLDYTDILFKFMGRSFTLEDVRITYEIIKDMCVDKSNFRKRIIKYCEKIEDNEKIKNGFRPSQKYKFKPLKGDVWL